MSPRRTSRNLVMAVAVGVGLALPAATGAHDLDHPVPPLQPANPPSSEFNAGGPGAKWNLIETLATGNPHTDIDFFTQGGQTYASVGTLAIGPNAGGQTIVQLTQGGQVDPRFVSSAPTASCLSDPNQALGLQHDAEATPKGEVPLNTANPFAVQSDAQLVIDATDNPGRCHDQGVLGLINAPQGGLEIIDITDPGDPVEIGLTSHIGEAHTVNVDPKRPHIAYVASSDAVAVNPDGTRENENVASAERFDLDGFEVVDFSSCMNFPPGTSVAEKRAQCRPQVFRYRYPEVGMALGHTLQTGANALFGCHETEIYPDDRLTCGSGNALMVFDVSGAFNDNGTPNDFTDDKPRGTPLPCRVRGTTSVAPFGTQAMVTDCVDTDGLAPNDDLTVPKWLASGAPSLDGVQWLGSVYHQGRGAGGPVNPTFDSTQDVDFDHEAELSHSGRLLIATDERGGGVTPPGASCNPASDIKSGNGGVHFYNLGGLSTSGPPSPDQAFQAYAQTPQGQKAIFRVPIRTQPQASLCTAHVFHQIPGQNRIFMGWYSQGTHVLDFVEEEDGTVRIEEAGFFIPEQADQWVSAIFDFTKNPDGTFTYYGATGDFALTGAGRNAIDVFEVTLPPAPLPFAEGQKRACLQRITGTRKRDKLFGSIDGDTIKGRRGNDRIKARSGDDCANGGGGRDRVAGGDGDDTVIGKKSPDKLRGGKGGDVIEARGGGSDSVKCGKGRDKAFVDGTDRVRGCERVRRKK